MAAAKGLMDHLFMAASEWFLMFMMFINAALSYFLTKFARYCDLEVPCLFCLRLDHFFGNEEHGYYLNMFCKKHKADISCLVSCNLHNKLADVQEMCEDCFMSIKMQRQLNSESHRLMVGTMEREREGYQRSYLNKNLVRTCSCCKKRWKIKSSGQRLIKPNAVRLGASKVTTKPPLPRVTRRGRSSRRDSLKRMRNKNKHHSVDALPTVRYSQLPVSSDSEYDFPFSDNDVSSRMGFDERKNSKVDSIVQDKIGNRNRYKIFSRHSYSASDLGSALLLEMQLDEILTTRSASLTPNSSIGYGLGDPNLSKLQTRSGSSCSSKLSSCNGKKDKKLYVDKNDGLGSSADFVVSRRRGNQNLRKIPAMHSFCASDLGSSFLLEMHPNESLRKRSASLTPSCSIGHSLGGSNNLQFPIQKFDPLPSTNSITGLGSSTNFKSNPLTTSLDTNNRNRSLDGFVFSHNTGSQNRSKIPARRSFSVSDLGSALLLNMYLDESIKRRSASLTPNPLGELNNSKFHLRNPEKRHPRKAKKNKRSLPSTNSVTGLGSSANVISDLLSMHGSFEDSVASRRNRSKIHARHSYSASDLGSTLLLEMHLNERLRKRSASLTPNCLTGHRSQELSSQNDAQKGHPPKGKKNRNSLPSISYDLPNASLKNQCKMFGRHSYSASDMGSALLLQMHIDQSLRRRSASLTPNCSTGQGLGELNQFKFQCRPSSSHTQEHSSLNFVKFPLQIVEKGHHPPRAKKHKKSVASTNPINGLGSSFDDFVTSRRMGSQNQHNILTRNSYSASDLGSTLLQQMHLEESLRRRSTSVTPYCSFGQELNLLKFQNRPNSYSQVLSSLNAMQFPVQHTDEGHPPKPKKHKKQGNQNRCEIHGRCSYSDHDLRSTLLQEMNVDESSRRRSTSVTPNFSYGQELNWSKLQTGPNLPHSEDVSSINTMQFHTQNTNEGHPPRNKKRKNPLPSINYVNRLVSLRNGYGSFDDSVVSLCTGSENRHNIRARHSYSASDLRSTLLIDMYLDEFLTSRSTFLTPNYTIGYGLGEPNGSRLQTRPSSDSHDFSSLNVKQLHHQNDQRHPPMPKKNKKPLPGLDSLTAVISDLSSLSLDKTGGHGFFDDSFASRGMGSKNGSNILSRNSFSASDLGSPLLQEMPINESLRRRSTSVTPNCSIGHGFGELNWPKFQNAEQGHPPEAKKHKKSVPLSDSLDKTDGRGSFDDSFVTRGMGSQNRRKIFSRNSFSASDLWSPLLREMHLNECLRRRAAYVTQNCSTVHGLGIENAEQGHPPKAKKHNKPVPLSASLDKTNMHGSFDDSFVSCGAGSQNRSTVLTRNSFSASDLTSPLLQDMHHNESLRRKATSLTPNCLFGHGFGELNWSKFQNAEQGHPPKTRKHKKSIPLSVSLDKTDMHGHLYDSFVPRGMGNQNRSNILTRNSFSAYDLGSPLLLEMHLNECLRRRSTSVTPNCSIGHGLGESNWSKFQTAEQGHPPKLKKHKKSIPISDSLDKTDGYVSFDNSFASRGMGSQNRSNVLTRNSFSASDLSSPLLQEMHLNESLRRRSASVTPNCSFGQEMNWSKFQYAEQGHPPKAKKHKKGNQYRSNILTRNSFSASDLGSPLLQEMLFNDSLRRRCASVTPNCLMGHGMGELKLRNVEEGHPPKGKKHEKSVPSNAFLHKTDMHGNFDNSILSCNTNQNQNKIHSRHSYSASDLMSELLQEMHLDNTLRRRSASLTPNFSVGVKDVQSYTRNAEEGHPPKPKNNKQPLPSFDDSINRRKSLTRNSFSASDLGSPLVLEMHLNERLTRRAASLTPNYQIMHGLDEQNWSKLDTTPRPCSQEFTSLNTLLVPVKKSKRSHPPKSKKNKKPLPFEDYVVSHNMGSQNRRHSYSASDLGSTLLLEMLHDQTTRRRSASLTPICSISHGLGAPNSSKFEPGRPPKAKKNKKSLKTDGYTSFDDSFVSRNTGSQNRYTIFSRHSYSTSDLGSALLLEMHLDERLTRRAASLTPNHSIQQSKFKAMKFPRGKTEEHDALKYVKSNIPLPSTKHTKETDLSNIRSDLSMDGSSVSEHVGEGVVEKLKRQVEHDRRCMSLLQTELEAERNAAAIAANQALTMITRLQQEKASLQMEALQYLRMMEEQAEYDMEALEKAKELVHEKENEIQDLLAELEVYRNKYGDDVMTGNESTETDNTEGSESKENGEIDANSSSESIPVTGLEANAPIKGIEDERRYFLQSLSTLEKKIHQFSMFNGVETHKDSSISKGVHDKSIKNENHVDLETLKQEIAYLNKRMEAQEVDRDFLEHACKTLHSNGGLEFIQEIAQQLRELRRIMFDRRCISRS